METHLDVHSTLRIMGTNQMRYILGWVRRVIVGTRGFFEWVKVGYPFVVLPGVLLVVTWLMGYGWLELVIIFSLGMILIIAEMFNYAIEKLCNFVEGKLNEDIRVIKDISAGAVFVSGVTLVAVSLYIIL